MIGKGLKGSNLAQEIDRETMSHTRAKTKKAAVWFAASAVLVTGLAGQTAKKSQAGAPAAASGIALGDWPEARGPERSGVSKEKGLPEKWTLNGAGMSWRAPYGSRSAPVVFGNRVYLQNPSGNGPTRQERVICFDADTGKVIWEYKHNLFQTDVPLHRVAWASPAVDVETGNVYTLAGHGTVVAISPAGKKLWERSLGEEFSLFTTHGGRTGSPLIDGNLVIVNAVSASWGDQANRSHRFYGIDKRTGDIVWVSTPGGRPYDTSYSFPIIANVDGTRLMIVGGGDGAYYGIKPQTGEPVWRYEISKRGINTGAVMNGKYAILSHSEENLDSTEMGLLTMIDATAKGQVKPESVKWAVKGFQAGVSSPIVDGDRYYQVDNSANVFAFDVQTGKQLWKQNLGSLQKASMVMGDGKLYVGTENGKFYILRPSADKCEVLSVVELPISKNSISQSEGTPEQVIAGAAISRGRVFFASVDALYAIGTKKPTTGMAVTFESNQGSGKPSWVQVYPTEQVVMPGQTMQFKARLFDEKGMLLGEKTGTWAVDGLKGTIADGKFTAAADNVGQAGLIKATIEGVTGQARVRILPKMPFEENFSSYEVGKVPPFWISATAGRFAVQELDGDKVMAKQPTETLFKRIRVFFTPTNFSNYTLEADVRAATKRRQMGDVGITAQRYSLVLFGNSQQIQLWSWQEQGKEDHPPVVKEYAWKPDTWYRLKIEVQNMPDGKVRARGKVWPRGETEPAEWTLEKMDAMGNKEGSAGFFADAQFGAFFDNVKVTPNK
jgi:outer membrane protein assembly factor BamB